METVSVLHQPLRWAVTNGQYVVLITYDRRFAEQIFNDLKLKSNPQAHWVHVKNIS